MPFIIILPLAIIGLFFKSTRKAAIAVLILCAAVAIAIFIFLYNLNTGMKWKQEKYTEQNHAQLAQNNMPESLADMIESKYVRRPDLSGQTQFWYQTNWYSSSDELLANLPFVSNEARAEYAEFMLDPNNIHTEDGFYKSYTVVPSIAKRNVNVYVIPNELIGTTELCLIVIDRDTGEALFSMFYFTM